MQSIDVTLPFSGWTVQVREMNGEDEDLLANEMTNEKKRKEGKAINHILARCTMHNGRPLDYNDAMMLASCDRQTLLLAIRGLSYDDEIRGTVKCRNPKCRAKTDLVYYQSKVSAYPKTAADFPNGQFDVTLSDRTQIICKLLTGTDEQALMNASEDDLQTMALFVRLVRVVTADGTVLERNDFRRWLKKLSVRYRSELRTAIEAAMIGPDTRWSFECHECGVDNEGSLEQLAGFFSLSRATPTAGSTV